jgi:hypothetical protein
MASLPRPLLALLAVVLAVFAAWMTVLKPSSSSSSSQNVPAPVVTTHTGGSGASHAKAHAAAVTGAATPRPAAKPAVKVSPAQRRLAKVDAALRRGQVLALLFYNPLGADDQADAKEVTAIPSHHGKVFKLAIPVQDLSRYSAITDQVPITGTPTLVVIDSHHRATMLAGFADQLEMNQLVAGALGSK